jgi:phosphoglycerate kinase
LEFPLLKNFDLKGKKVLLRVDINSPIDPETGEILDDTRIRSHTPTIRFLENTKLVVLAHQSRPGLRDFTPLEVHARKLEEINGRPVKYVDELFGSRAREEIARLDDGEILVLENVRFCSEEISPQVMAMPPEKQAKTNFVRRLSACVDFYVNDAFAVAHRPQPSVTAFPYVLPCAAGKLMETEISSLSRVLLSSSRPKVFLFGGAKVKDSLRVIQRLLEKDIADAILTSGLVANLFLLARGCRMGRVNRQTLEDKSITGLTQKAKNMLKKYGGKIELPVDLAFQKNGSRVEAPADKVGEHRILDIGIETIIKYSRIIKESGVVVANGPCGLFELEAFAMGTEEILRAMADSRGFTVIGGGHLSAIARNLGALERLSYASTGGKATMYFLAGETLPGIEALKKGKHD